ncbi:MAG: hypothetical protein M3N54_06225 [Acidobacteriota bacterium]|nr:hypothetical protein [Acidobacteriota bacterium]
MRAGYTCVSMLIAGGLVAAGLFAGQSTAPVSVTLPHAVTVGNTVLPSGEYTISSIDMANGDEYFVIRSAHSPTVTLQAQKLAAGDDLATQVVFSKDGETWHFDKMFIQGTTKGSSF